MERALVQNGYAIEGNIIVPGLENLRLGYIKVVEQKKNPWRLCFSTSDERIWRPLLTAKIEQRFACAKQIEALIEKLNIDMDELESRITKEGSFLKI